MLLVAVFIMAGDAFYSPTPARADIGPIPTPDPCSLIPNKTARAVCRAATNPIGTAADAIGIPSPTQVVGDAVAAGAKAIVKPILVQVTQIEGDAVVATLKKLNSFTNNATTPDTNAEWFKRQYALLFGLASAMAVLFLILRLGAARLDPTETGKGGAAILTFIVLMGMMPAAVAGILKLTDDTFTPKWMELFANNGDTTLSNVETKMVDDLSVIGAVAALLIPLIILFFGLLASVVFTLMLTLRYEVIFILTGLLPVAAAFSVGGRLGGQTLSKVSYGLLGWILMKPAIAIVLTFGLATMTQGGGAEPITLGAVILILSIAVPWKLTQAISNHNIRPPHETVWRSAAVQTARAKVASALASG